MGHGGVIDGIDACIQGKTIRSARYPVCLNNVLVIGGKFFQVRCLNPVSFAKADLSRCVTGCAAISTLRTADLRRFLGEKPT